MDQTIKLNLTLVSVETVQVPESNLGSLDFGFQVPVLSQVQGVLSHQYVTTAVYVCAFIRTARVWNCISGNTLKWLKLAFLPTKAA